jgi:hypothetical protein
LKESVEKAIGFHRKRSRLCCNYSQDNLNDPNDENSLHRRGESFFEATEGVITSLSAGFSRNGGNDSLDFRAVELGASFLPQLVGLKQAI